MIFAYVLDAADGSPPTVVLPDVVANVAASAVVVAAVANYFSIAAGVAAPVIIYF